MQTALIALGGNLGNVPASIRQAVELIRNTGSCANARLSRLFRTAPVGGNAGCAFLNAALALETKLGPQRLLDRLHAIEEGLGRVRTAHWGPRVLDLDLIGQGGQIVATPQLTLPHAHCWYRRFVLDPLMDVAPDWRHPVFGRTVVELRERLLVRPLPVCLEQFPADATEAVQRTYGEEVKIHSVAAGPDARVRMSIGSSGPSEFSLILVPENAADMAVQILRAALDAPEPLADWPGDPM